MSAMMRLSSIVQCAVPVARNSAARLVKTNLFIIASQIANGIRDIL